MMGVIPLFFLRKDFGGIDLEHAFIRIVQTKLVPIYRNIKVWKKA